MGTNVFKMPDIGEGVVEGEITAWHVAVGDSVVEDQEMVEIMTDKATVGIGSTVDGKVTKLHGAVGDMIAEPTPASVPKPSPSASTSDRPLASPAVRRRAKEEGVSLSQVSGTGPAGRITHADFDSYLSGGDTVGGLPIPKAGVERSGVTEVPIIGLRRKIAEQMTKAYTSIPHFSYFEEVDVTDLEALRGWMNSNRTEDQPKLT